MMMHRSPKYAFPAEEYRMSRSRRSTHRQQKPKQPQADQLLNGPDVPVEDKQRQLEGRRPADQQGEPFIEVDDTDDLGEISTTDVYLGELEAGVNDDLPNDPDQLELLTERELRAGETDNPFEAAEEGIPYVPPIDPPTVPRTEDDQENAQVASGMSVSALEEPYDADHHRSFYPADDEMSARVRDALRADSSTTQYAETVTIITRGSVVVLRGEVDDLTDSDNLVAVAGYVTGVDEVIDELTIRAFE
jgi:hypothetical protein